MKKAKTLTLIALVLILGCLSSYYVQTNILKNTTSKRTNEIIIPNEKNTTKTNKEQITTANDTIDKLREKYNNQDVIGKISISNTEVDEIIMQAKDNDYYLTHDNYKNSDKYGSVFLDYRCNKESKKLLIFGHSSTKVDTPFNQLENYYQEDYYQNHPYIDLLIEDEIRKYLIFSVYVEVNDFTYMNLKIDTSKYKEDLIKYQSKSLYDTKVSVDENDEILIMQTCSNLPEYKKYPNKYLLIIAKRIK